MRSSLAVLGLLSLPLAGSVAQTAPAPGTENRRLEVFAGTWNYTGQAKPGPFGPGGPVAGTDHVEMLGGFTLVRRYEEKNPGGLLRGVEVLHYDASKKAYTDNVFDSNGLMAVGTWIVAGNVWSLTSTVTVGAGSFQQRCLLNMAASAASFNIKCDLSSDGATWVPVFEGNWTKAAR